MKPIVFLRRHFRRSSPFPSVLAWSAAQRVLAVLPLLALVWLGVAWAQLEAAPL